ncbi:MAG: TMEM175 family protein [Bacteroidota bacterium]
MNKTRLEAFSDGVIAIIITIMVLEIHMPDTANWESFRQLSPMLTGYILSFIFIGIYWNNHHHLLHTVKQVTGAMMWANLNLLFWLSLVPLATTWMDKTCFSSFAVVVYAVLLLMCGLSFDILRRIILSSLPPDSHLRETLGKLNFKSILSVFCYSLAVAAAFWHTYVSICLFAFVAIVWIVPSRDIEKGLADDK